MRRGPDGVRRLVELDRETPPAAAPAVVADIAPYRSMRTGERIAGRAQHREHLRRHGLVEVGNEWAAFSRGPADPGSAPGEIAREVKRELARDPGERRAEAETLLRRSGYDGPQIDRIIGERT